MPHSKGIACRKDQALISSRVRGRSLIRLGDWLETKGLGFKVLGFRGLGFKDPLRVLHDVKHVNLSSVNGKHFKEGQTDPSLFVKYFAFGKRGGENTDPSLFVTYFPSGGLGYISYGLTNQRGKEKPMSLLTKKL
jgi:hypothetical protein